MVKLLVASEFEPGRFKKCFTIKLNGNGSGAMPAKWQGSLQSYAARVSAKQMAADSAIADINYEFGSTKLRVTRIA